MERGIASFAYQDNKVEYSITGVGEPILYLHGDHSNCHEQLGFQELVDQGFSIIAPSRAGYGETSKEIGKSLAKACSFYVELLNELGVESAHVIAVSTGGPSGIYLASHYPERVKSLTLQGAVTKTWLTPDDKEYKTGKLLYRPFIEKAFWKSMALLTSVNPDYAFKKIAPSYSTMPYSKIKGRMLARDWYLFRKMMEIQRSKHGFLIDLYQTNQIALADLESIASPTLIIHSTNDAVVSTEHANHANKHIQQSKLVLSNTWGHVLCLGEGSEENTKETIDFLKSCSSSMRQSG
ncbi:alpha/beta fold hydrolase [Shouchella shacheensis]|uniref:alpha/beta fold hydrolase n=1 Tax=Shouchella shacheensis TaxID=1649580 RepID=UPI000740262B|nr:alpha/beta hydrolase [Shouchella shacheensis]